MAAKQGQCGCHVVEDDLWAAVRTGEVGDEPRGFVGSDRYASYMQVLGALGFKAEGRRIDRKSTPGIH